ncbi:MAG: hypothetical protein M3160_05945 [Candidatus Eremiobacteraeota bacterium]|nr:hypothetical protein [Candidatus Eremiobacteraeota bacterium]
MTAFSFHIVAVLAVAIWAACVYAIIRRNEHVELHRAFVVPLAFMAFVATVALLFALFLPTPWNMSAAIATVGFGLSAWSDLNTGYLWDDAVISTAFVCAAIMILGGRGQESIAGGTVCGIVASAYYFLALLCGKPAGYGDVKLVAGIGFALGPMGGVAAYFIGVILMSAGVLLVANLSRKPARELLTKPMPFGLAFIGGLMISAALLPYFNAVRSGSIRTTFTTTSTAVPLPKNAGEFPPLQKTYTLSWPD